MVQGHQDCGYDAPNDPFVETILSRISKASVCASHGFYKRFLESVRAERLGYYNVVTSNSSRIEVARREKSLYVSPSKSLGGPC